MDQKHQTSAEGTEAQTKNEENDQAGLMSTYAQLMDSYQEGTIEDVQEEQTKNYEE